MTAAPGLNNPVAERYLDTLNSALSAMPPGERAEVIAEIRNHITDATAAGRPLDEVLQRLGSAQTLARSYQVELLLNPRQSGANWSTRMATLFGLVVMGSLPTFILTILLGSIGFSFTLAGFLVFVAGCTTALGLGLPPGVHMDGPPWLAIVAGPTMAVLGLVSLWALYRYLKWVIWAIRKLAFDRPNA